MMKSRIANVVLLLTVPLLVHAQVDPHIDWKVLQSAHFHLIYDAQQQELADYYLDRLERARAKLETLWVYVPEKLTVVLNDRTDLTNGFATPLPYDQVQIFPVLPGPQESISEYGDWAEEVLLHEMTHIESFEQRRGIPEGLRHVFGSIITPNILLPTWWLEGVAVDAETRLSNWGRLRSTYQDASLRTLVSSPRWEKFRLGEINETEIPDWPYGSRPYLFGSLMWSEMIALKGEKMVNDLHVRFGGRMPFLLSSPIEENFDDKDLADLFERTKTDVAGLVLEQRKQLEKVPFSKSDKFHDDDFMETMSPSISPDGLKLAFVAKDDTLKRSVQVLRRPSTQVPFQAGQRVRAFGQKTEITTPTMEIKVPRLQEQEPDFPPTGTINRISWNANSNAFVFDLVQEKNLFHDVSDLWIFDFEKAKARQLTHGLRAREPQYSPDGSKIAFIKLEKDRTSLAVWDVASEKETILYRPGIMGRVAWPVWLDGDRLLFSVRVQGHERLGWQNISTGHVEWPRLPVKSASLPLKKGERVYFVSWDNGVRNLYETDPQFRHTKPATHLWSGAYAADFDLYTNELWITQIGDMGFEMTRLPLKNELKTTTLPTVKPLLASRYPARDEKPLETVTDKQIEDYSPLPYLLPRYWLPFFYWDDKGVQISASTGGSDPLGKNAYALYGAYDTAINRGSYEVAYQNQSFTPTLTLQSMDLYSYLADPAQVTRYESNLAASTWQLPGIDPYLFFSAGWVWVARQQVELSSWQTGPTIGFSYANASQTGRQISPENGGGAQITATHYLQGAASDQPYTETTLEAVKFGRIPFFHHHAWMFRAIGQYIDHDVSVANYDSSLSTLAATVPNMKAYQMRGYVTGAFLGKNIANASLEYRFPISRIDHGPDHGAIFFQRISGAVVTDGIWLDGYVYDTNPDESAVYRLVKFSKGFGDAGIEAKLDLDLGYHFPMELILGVYQPLNSQYTDGNPHLGLGILL